MEKTMTPTNTPTSMCEVCDPFPGKSCSNKSFSNCNHECHTPTTDSKNSSEKCQYVHPDGYCGMTEEHTHPTQNTTPNSSEDWEKGYYSFQPNTPAAVIRENLEWYKETGADHGDLVIAEEAIHTVLKSFIQHIEKEEYDRGYYEGEKNEFHNQAGRMKEAYEHGRKDAVEFIRENCVEVRTAGYGELGQFTDFKYALDPKTLEAALETP